METSDVIAACGGVSETARKLGLARSTVSEWKAIPLAHIKEISKMSGIPVSDLIKLYADKKL